MYYIGYISTVEYEVIVDIISYLFCSLKYVFQMAIDKPKVLLILDEDLLSVLMVTGMKTAFLTAMKKLDAF